MPTVAIEHIEVDESGNARVAGTRSRVINIVLDTLNGLTPAQIHEAYPPLSLAQIHAALAYYYDHKAQLDAEIEEELCDVDSLRRQSGQPSRDEVLQIAAKAAIKKLQASSASTGKDRLTTTQIDSEVRAARRERR
jgi:uncharacterized protein (DUF433 family)